MLSVGSDWVVRWDDVAGAISYEIDAVDKDNNTYTTSHGASDVPLSTILQSAPNELGVWNLYIRAELAAGFTDNSQPVTVNVTEGNPPGNFRLSGPSTGPITAATASLFVDAVNGNDSNNGTVGSPFLTIQKAMDVATPGDIIWMQDGVYLQDATTPVAGIAGSPIVLAGSRRAVVSGAGNARPIEVNHSYWTFHGFTCDMLHDYLNPDLLASYRDKCIYAVPPDLNDPVTYLTNLIFRDILFRNNQAEALRVRFLNTGEIDNCHFENVGREDFEFAGGGKNGEAVYIGTDPQQLTNPPEPEFDQTTDVWVHHCYMNTEANEGVDIKEKTTGCIVEFNEVTGQLDPNSGGMESRGDNNTFRNNMIYNCQGAGIRLGGDDPDQGVNNTIRDNLIFRCDNSGIKIMRDPQTLICGNTFFQLGGPDLGGTFGGSYTNDPCP